MRAEHRSPHSSLFFFYQMSTADHLSKSSSMSVSIIKAVCISNRIFHLQKKKQKKPYVEQHRWMGSFVSTVEKNTHPL